MLIKVQFLPGCYGKGVCINLAGCADLFLNDIPDGNGHGGSGNGLLSNRCRSFLLNQRQKNLWHRRRLFGLYGSRQLPEPNR